MHSKYGNRMFFKLLCFITLCVSINFPYVNFTISQLSPVFFSLFFLINNKCEVMDEKKTGETNLYNIFSTTWLLLCGHFPSYLCHLLYYVITIRIHLASLKLT